MSQQFSWADVADDIVVKRQTAVAVYFNGDADIVIRQESVLGEDEPFIVLTVEAAKLVAEALVKLATMESDD